ncbi:MAG TPA: ABC transporter permease [Candidatus Baltobacteraceae bacterium]
MTRFLAYVHEAWDALWRNKARSALTMLGMLIGVAAVNSVYGLTSGLTASVNSGISSSHFPSLTIIPDPQQADPSQAQLQFRDSQILADETGGSLARVVPVYTAFSGGGAPRVYQVRKGSRRVSMYGFSWYGDDPDMDVLVGRGLTGADILSAAAVCMISHDLAVEFFKTDAAALGQYLLVNGSRFRIVGVPDPNKGSASNGYFGGTYYMLLPYTTYRSFQPGPIDGLDVWESPSTTDAEAEVSIRAVFAHTHGAAAKYTITSIRDQLAQQVKIVNVIGVGLTAIGAISLLVAGIGIMNIMLISVTERTREIGIRKSIGASRKDIVLQFIIESTLVSLFGGALGLFLSLGVIGIAAGAMNARTGNVNVPWGSVVLAGLVFSIAVGLVFGTYPAIRASQLDPVEALRS